MGLTSTSGQSDPGIPMVGASVSQRDEASIESPRPIHFGVMFNGAYHQEWQASCVDLGLFIVDGGDSELRVLEQI